MLYAFKHFIYVLSFGALLKMIIPEAPVMRLLIDTIWLSKKNIQWLIFAEMNNKFMLNLHVFQLHCALVKSIK